MPRLNSSTSHLGKYFPPQPLDVVYLTEFDIKCEQLGLDTFEKQLESVELRKWVELFMKRYYVPEKLLKAWDLHVFVDVD